METIRKHTKANQAKIDLYNRMTSVTQGLSGGANSSPQNSGVIMANINLSEPIIRSSGYCSNYGCYADSRQVRGEENVLILLSRITDDELKRFRFMRITDVKTVHEYVYHKDIKKAAKWEFVKLEKKEDVKILINANKEILERNS